MSVSENISNSVPSTGSQVGPWFFAIRVNRGVKRLAINAFLLFHLAVIVSRSIPSQALVVRIVSRMVSPYAWRVGLFQSWDMFAPNPTHVNVFVTAEITCSDGQVRVWNFPQMQELGYSERYFKERYRKYSTEYLRVDSHSVLWPDAARYIARLHRNPGNPPTAVRLIRHWSEMNPPGPGGRYRPSPWQQYMYYTYLVQPGDLE